MLGLLDTGAGQDPSAPAAPWGRDTSLGAGEVSARGNSWGSELGDAFGAGGLGLSGIGEGLADGVGQNAGPVQGPGFGYGSARSGGSHPRRAPKVRMGAASVSGRLPPEVIKRIVRQNQGRFRMCYEQGLRLNPNLEGRVVTRFVIGKDGSVSNAANAGSDLPDSQAVACVVRAFNGLSFPKPESGEVGQILL